MFEWVVIHLEKQDSLEKIVMYDLFSGGRILSNHRIFECLLVLGGVWKYRCPSISRTAWLPRIRPAYRESGLMRAISVEKTESVARKFVRVIEGPTYRSPTYWETPVNVFEYLMDMQFLLMCTAHLHQILSIRRQFLFWPEYIYRYVSLYQTSLCRNARYTGQFTGNGTLLLDWLVLLLTRIQDEPALCQTPEHTGLTRRICISIRPPRTLLFTCTKKLDNLLDQSIPKTACLILKTKSLDAGHAARARSSVAVLAEILLRSPQKIFIFIIKKYVYRIKVSKNKIIRFWKKLHWRESATKLWLPPAILF